MKFRFEIDENKWNYVEEKGLPEDGSWCMLIIKSNTGKYSYEIGGYNSYQNTFYVNFGMGGVVLKADSVVAWALLFDDEDGYLKQIDN